MHIDLDPDDDPGAAYAGSAIDLPWLIVGLCAAVVMAICAAAERGVRAGRRIARHARVASGSRLIDLGARVMPDPPATDADDDRARRVVGALARARVAGRRNGKAKGGVPT